MEENQIKYFKMEELPKCKCCKPQQYLIDIENLPIYSSNILMELIELTVRIVAKIQRKSAFLTKKSQPALNKSIKGYIRAIEAFRMEMKRRK